MAYVTIDDWAANRYPASELIQLTDTDGFGFANQSVFDSAEEQARDIVNGYLRRLYVVPITPIPPTIKLITLDILRWILHKQGAPEDIILKKDEALGRLKDYARGVSTLDAVTRTSNPVGVAASIVSPVFSVMPDYFNNVR